MSWGHRGEVSSSSGRRETIATRNLPNRRTDPFGMSVYRLLVAQGPAHVRPNVCFATNWANQGERPKPQRGEAHRVGLDVG